MGVSELSHDPDLSIEEYKKAVADLKDRYVSLLKARLYGIKDSMLDYFIDTHNTNRLKLMGDRCSKNRRMQYLYPQEFAPHEEFVNNVEAFFNVESLETMLVSLEYTPFEDIPVALGNYVEGELSHTFLLWRLKVGI